jgi:hypothetical protein
MSWCYREHIIHQRAFESKSSESSPHFASNYGPSVKNSQVRALFEGPWHLSDTVPSPCPYSRITFFHFCRQRSWNVQRRPVLKDYWDHVTQAGREQEWEGFLCTQEGVITFLGFLCCQPALEIGIDRAVNFRSRSARAQFITFYGPRLLWCTTHTCDFDEVFFLSPVFCFFWWGVRCTVI